MNNAKPIVQKISFVQESDLSNLLQFCIIDGFFFAADHFGVNKTVRKVLLLLARASKRETLCVIFTFVCIRNWNIKINVDLVKEIFRPDR